MTLDELRELNLRLALAIAVLKEQNDRDAKREQARIAELKAKCEKIVKEIADLKASNDRDKAEIAKYRAETERLKLWAIRL